MAFIEDPELEAKKTQALYKVRGYSDAWIENRLRSTAIREKLPDKWKKPESIETIR